MEQIEMMSAIDIKNQDPMPFVAGPVLQHAEPASDPDLEPDVEVEITETRRAVWGVSNARTGKLVSQVVTSVTAALGITMSTHQGPAFITREEARMLKTSLEAAYPRREYKVVKFSFGDAK